MKLCATCYWSWRIDIRKWGKSPCSRCNSRTIDRYWRKDI